MSFPIVIFSFIEWSFVILVLVYFTWCTVIMFELSWFNTAHYTMYIIQTKHSLITLLKIPLVSFRLKLRTSYSLFFLPILNWLDHNNLTSATAYKNQNNFECHTIKYDFVLSCITHPFRKRIKKYYWQKK